MDHEKTLTILLASASPRRHQILQEHGFNVKAIPANIPEQIQPHETAAAYVVRLAYEKAHAVLAQEHSLDADFILAADTVVAFEGQVLEKPENAKEAYAMLHRLSGQKHEVYTGYYLASLNAQQYDSGYVTTEIYFKPLSETMIHEYIRTGDPFDKAGAYGIQNVRDTFIQKISGSYYNVMGLPIEEIAAKIRTRF